MPEDTPDFIPHTSASTDTPDFIPHSSASAGGDASGTKGALGKGAIASQPTAKQLGYDPLSSHAGGMAREFALGGLSGATGLGEHVNPLEGAKGSMEGDLGYQIGQHITGDPNAPGYLDMVKQHNPFSQAIGTAQGLYGAGKEIATAPDVEGIAHGAGSFMGQLAQLSMFMKQGRVPSTEATAAARAIERHVAINEGQVKVANGMVKAPLAMLDAKVNAEIGKHVDAVLQADELHNKITNNPAGYVNAVDAAGEAAKASDKIGGEFAPRVGKLIERASTGPMTMRDAKALTTDVGREQASMSRSGKSREAAVLTQLYDSLHEATASRADDLGSAYAKSWQHYIDETRSYKDMQGGLLGKLTSEPNHAKVLDHLNNPDNAIEAKEIVKKMKQYNVDPKPFTKAQEISTDLKNASDQVKGVFQGKIRAIMKYPMAAGTGAAGASLVAHASKIPGMGFVLPLIVAAKIGGMLDNAAMKGILNDINKRVPPEMGQVHEPGAGPMPAPSTPSPEGITPPGPPKEATPGEVDDMAAAQQGEDDRQAMARKLSRTRKSKGKP